MKAWYDVLICDKNSVSACTKSHPYWNKTSENGPVQSTISRLMAEGSGNQSHREMRMIEII